MQIEVHSYASGVSADVTIEGQRMTVPEAIGNRHWAMLQEWIAAGNSWPDVPAPTLSERKEQRLAELATIRWDQEIGGIELGAMRVKTDPESAGKLTAAHVTATENPAYLIENWKVAPGVFVSLDAPTIIMAAGAVRDHVQSCFNREALLSAAILSATTIGELEAIDLTAGW
jgi:hypothetical protein